MNFNNYSLNENQQRAVDWNEGPLLVLAGPGSGKTLVLTLRATRLLQDNFQASVLALTFTNKAADEMRRRIDEIMGERADRIHLCTFHSFAGDILRQHGSHVGIQPDFSLLTLEEDRIALLDFLLSEKPSHYYEYREYSEKFQLLKEKLKNYTASIPADHHNLLVLLDRLFADSYNCEFKTSITVKTPSWIPIFFEAYCQLLIEHNRLDYGGLLYFAKKLLSENKGVLRITRLAWKYICVDEFQDTNRAQYDLLHLLVDSDNPNLFVVADDDQIIYQWNGASPERLQVLLEDYEMGIVQLPENYRCPSIIIKYANHLIRHNHIRNKYKKPLISLKSNDKSDFVTIQEYSDEYEEYSAISKIIIKNDWNVDECVVLARSGKILEKTAQSLVLNGFTPYYPRRKNEFECSSIRLIYAALRLANTRHDREYLRRLCLEWKNFTERIIEVVDVEAEAALCGGDFLRAWIDIALNEVTCDSHKVLLQKFRQYLVDRLLVIEFLDWFWSIKWSDDPLETEEKETWIDLHNEVIREHSLENITLHLYLQELDLKSKICLQTPGSLSLLTVHAAKGLEYKHVFLIGMVEGIFPSYHAVRKGPICREMEEERRNCFVAITRVKETLCISWAKNYDGYSGKNPSRFIKEMDFLIENDS
ncbi:ATP-dependent helicase [Methanospirillum lacunae]|nr:ATP-dependent helicase [Methanospirillum lacunae]